MMPDNRRFAWLENKMSWSPCPDPIPGDRASAEAIEMLIVPRAVDLGEMQVRRALPSVKRQMVGPFIFFDQMGPGRVLDRSGHRRASASAYQSRDRDIALRRPDPAPGQPRHREDD
jgi:hypothetical protein